MKQKYAKVCAYTQECAFVFKSIQNYAIVYQRVFANKNYIQLHIIKFKKKT